MKETLHNMVYNDILKKIRNGELKIGEKLPTEMELCEIYSVSRITISRAMRDLAKLDIIYRVKRGGTFVNGKARALKPPLVIPVILPFPEDFNEIFKGIQRNALDNHIFTPFYNSESNVLLERRFLTEILTNNLDGLIVYPCSSLHNIDLYAQMITKNVPIVCIDRKINGLDTPLITTANAKNMMALVNKLVAMGHSKIGFCAVSNHMSLSESERFKGFCEGMIANHLPIRPEFIFNLNDLHQREQLLSTKKQSALLKNYIEGMLQSYLKLEDKPTAVCCINYHLLKTTADIARKSGLNIPNDLVLAGFDCNAPDKKSKTNYLSVNQNFYQIGNAALTLMIELINGEPHRNYSFVDGILAVPEQP